MATNETNIRLEDVLNNQTSSIAEELAINFKSKNEYGERADDTDFQAWVEEEFDGFSPEFFSKL